MNTNKEDRLQYAHVINPVLPNKPYCCLDQHSVQSYAWGGGPLDKVDEHPDLLEG